MADDADQQRRREYLIKELSKLRAAQASLAQGERDDVTMKDEQDMSDPFMDDDSALWNGKKGWFCFGMGVQMVIQGVLLLGVFGSFFVQV